MVHFAWETFSNYQRSRGNDPQKPEDIKLKEYMDDFKATFCKPHVHVHFLGLFDCVNSVGQFEIPLFRKSYRYMATPAAKHIRHAVSMHERRLKFKPALFVFDRTKDEHDGEEVDSQEIWFAGNHGDSGGGWAPEEKHSYLLSDTTLTWMIDELKNVRPSKDGGELKLLEEKVEGHREDAKKLWHANDSGNLKKPIRSHDMLKYGRGAKWYMTFIWWIIGKSSSP